MQGVLSSVGWVMDKAKHKYGIILHFRTTPTIQTNEQLSNHRYPMGSIHAMRQNRNTCSYNKWRNSGRTKWHHERGNNYIKLRITSAHLITVKNIVRATTASRCHSYNYHMSSGWWRTSMNKISWKGKERCEVRRRAASSSPSMMKRHKTKEKVEKKINGKQQQIQQQHERYQ